MTKILNPLRVPKGCMRLPVRMHPEYYKYLHGTAIKANVHMADLIRVLIHMAPENQEFNEWLDRRIKTFGTADYIIIQGEQTGQWGVFR